MAMPGYVYLVSVVDCADAERLIAHRVFKTGQAAKRWGASAAQARAEAAHAAGQDVIEYDYRVRVIEYVDN